ncbi:hypothetical protein ABZT06_17940 [Streptomyces sp. NPDC005483]|uniref:hypothetical protein n=1 Tax=Streptomyces sp. NPDC005483 TaxID=3154882 RepID=UPI0033B6F102
MALTCGFTYGPLPGTSRERSGASRTAIPSAPSEPGSPHSPCPGLADHVTVHVVD